ncbi:MAG: LTA synthase family protein [Gemmatimonadales bacterium]
MTARLKFCFGYFAFWMAFFALLRASFLLYHHAEAARAGFGTVVGVMVHGARMDVASSSYLAAIAFVLAAFSAFLPRIAGRAILVFSILALTSFSLLAAIDMEVFRAWGFHADAAILRYFNTPREMMASISSSPVALLFVIWVALATVSVVAFLKLLWLGIRAWGPLRIPVAIVTFVLCGGLTWLLYYPSRGGIQKMPMTQSTVYFSRNAFANQAAINVAWNFFDSVWWNTYRTDNPYRVMADAEATRTADSLLASSEVPRSRLLRLSHPDVILIMWESFSSKVVERLGGVRGVTPNIDSLIHDGILFDHFYATGDRSPEGLVGVLSGYPAQPITEIIQHPRKSAALPVMTHDLARAGYHTAFYYGGDPEFSNIKSYLVHAGFDTLVTKDAFPRDERHSDWGADDGFVLNRLASDLTRMPRPFFAYLFTLSSHEPFIVPMATVIPGTDERSLFLNAHAYTDRSIGDFIRRAKQQPWWDSTLVVILADHGHRVPVLDSLQSDRKWETFAIPMLWLGGALAVRDTVVTEPGVQTDLPKTLLDQLGLDASAYRWSRNLFAADIKPWAWFTFTDGFGWIDGSGGALAWDNVGHRPIAQRGQLGPGDVHAGEAMLQLLIDDYIKR